MSGIPRSIRVAGPAYLDRVLRIDGPLRPGGEGPPFDRSIAGELAAGGDGLEIRGRVAALIVRPLPTSWPGPTGTVRIADETFPWRGEHEVAASSWADDLGGMGAGYAAALGGRLDVVLGDPADPIALAIRERLDRVGVAARVLHREGFATDWTLLLTSGRHGDKLPIGFRGVLEGLADLPTELPPRADDLLLVASLNNRLAARIFREGRATIRLFAPTSRNMADRDEPISTILNAIDVIVCNRREWALSGLGEGLPGPVSLASITDGPAGGSLRFRDPAGASRELHIPAFPRASPPRDTNRAGEAYASTLIRTLMDAAWTPGPVAADLLRHAARRASAAAALVLDFEDFRFPTAAEIDAALAAGMLRSPTA